MRSHLHITAAAAILVAELGTTGVLAHPGCYTPDETPTVSVKLEFCELESDGACCTPTQESDAKAVFELAELEAGGSLSSDCADLYKQVACGPCSAYAGHLYEVLGAELGVEDGMTMKDSFCSELTAECAGEIAFKSYDGQSYCQKHVGGDDDQLWSYPIDPSETTFTSSGLVKAFPDLDDDDLPNDTIAMHMTPDGTKWWLGGQDGEIREISLDEPSSSTQVVNIGVLDEFYRAYEEGLLDFAFDPNFSNNNLFYISYTIDINEGRINRLSKFEYIPGDAGDTLGTEDVVLESSPKETSIHSGGWCGFKPSDYGSSGSHDIYWAIGDGGPQEDTTGAGGDPTTILASIVRISVSEEPGYGIPSGNYNGGAGSLPEICAKGFRNPFRCGFDSANDNLYCGDVGHTKVESIDKIECGNDYGWSRFEGSRCQSAQEDRFDDSCSDLSRSGLVFPIFEYCHPDYDSSESDEGEYTDGQDICGARTVVGNAVIGGYPYRGQRFSEVLTGALLFADVQQKKLFYLVDEGNGQWVPGTIISDGSASIISFAEGNDGELYIITSDRVPHLLPCGDLCAITCLTQAETQPVYKSEGCFGDFSGDRALTLASSIGCPDGQDLMSPAVCSSYCATIEGSTYFGVEFAYECFCGGDDDKFDKHDPLDMEQCETLCTGTPDEFCGGRNAIEVYSFGPGVPQTPSPIGAVLPPPTDGNDDYVSFGCFVDSVSNRVLSAEFTVFGADNSIEACATKCAGSAYFGTEFGTECFCSASGDDPTELGPATCSQACNGDSFQICGDRNAISVYEYVDTVTPPTPPTTPTTPSEEYVYRGCHADVSSPRVFNVASTKDATSMTADYCAGFCSGNQYFGTQYGSECWCGAAGTVIDVNGPGTCDYACTGDADETCGGFFAFSAYEYTDGVVVPPTSAVDLGCFVDSKSARIMTFESSSGSMSAKECSAACPANVYFGLQYGSECWCSDEDLFRPNEATNCDYPCTGDKSQNCGGYTAMRVYQNAG